MATKNAVASGFDEAFATTPRKETGPSYGQLSYAAALMSVELGFTAEQRKVLRTRTGMSALIEMLKAKHGATLDKERDAAGEQAATS